MKRKILRRSLATMSASVVLVAAGLSTGADAVAPQIMPPANETFINSQGVHSFKVDVSAASRVSTQEDLLWLIKNARWQNAESKRMAQENSDCMEELRGHIEAGERSTVLATKQEIEKGIDRCRIAMESNLRDIAQNDQLIAISEYRLTGKVSQNQKTQVDLETSSLDKIVDGVRVATPVEDKAIQLQFPVTNGAQISERQATVIITDPGGKKSTSRVRLDNQGRATVAHNMKAQGFYKIDSYVPYVGEKRVQSVRGEHKGETRSKDSKTVRFGDRLSFVR